MVFVDENIKDGHCYRCTHDNNWLRLRAEMEKRQLPTSWAKTWGDAPLPPIEED